MVYTLQALGVFTCLLLVACGGGGGGGSSSSGGPPAPPPAAGSFTLSTSTAAFRAPRLHDLPASQAVTMAVTGSGVAAVTAMTPAAQTAPWLVIEVTGSGPNYTITLRPNTTQLDIGTATTTVTVATSNAAGGVLASRDIQVSYEVYQGIVLTSMPAQSFVFGGVETANTSFGVNSYGRNYRVTSQVPWLTVPAGAQSGSVAVPVGVNVAALAPGTHFGSIIVTAANDPADTSETGVQVTIALPTLSMNSTSMLIGGEDGLGTSLSGSLDLSLNTGANSWPWAVQVQGFSVPAALTTPVTSGTVSATAATFTLGADRTQLRPGTYAATLHFTATIKGVAIARDVPLTINWESQRLVPRYDGLAFTSTATRVPTARQVVINDSRGRTGIPWTAVADAQWLHVSPASGVTGDTLTVTVTPGGLLTDSLYNGTIVLTSTDPGIERPEAIRVGLWKASTNPVNVSRQLTDLSGSWVTNPVEPWAYSISRKLVAQPGEPEGQAGGIIRVYHVFTGDLLATFPSGATHAGSMAISSDGTKLFVTDYGAPRTIAIDALSGAQLAIYPASQMAHTLFDERRGIAFLRMNGRPVVWPAFSPDSTVRTLPIDVETGQGLHLFSSGPGPVGEYGPRYGTVQAPSPDGQFLYVASVSQYAIVEPTQHYFSVLDGGPRIRAVAGQFYGHGDGVEDICVTADNRVWQSTGYMPMPAYDSHMENVVAAVAMPTTTLTGGIICGAHGRNYVSIREYNGDGTEDNIAMFSDSGALLGTYRHGSPGPLLTMHGMKLSGDGSRIVWARYSVLDNRAVDMLEISTPP